MSRIAAIDPSAADPKVQTLLEAVRKSLGMVPNLFRVAAQSPAALEGLLNLEGAAARGRLPLRTREAIALAVAEANGCDYCLSAHSLLGQRAGLSESAIAAARAGTADDARTAAVLGFARAVLAKRGEVSDADLAAARAAGISDGELVETVAHTVLNIFTNYLNNVAHTEIDFPVVRHGHALAA